MTVRAMIVHYCRTASNELIDWSTRATGTPLRT